MNNTSASGYESQAAQKPRGFPVRLRFCYHLRLCEAKRMKAGTIVPHVFQVPADACWVVVPQEFGDGWSAVLPLLSDEQTVVERKQGLQANLGRVSPSPSDSASHVLDIPERYPAKLLRDAEHDQRQGRREGALRLVAPAQDDPSVPYGAAQLRYCYYLHLNHAEKAIEWSDEQPMFNVPYKGRWVLVRKYLRDGTVQIYQLTSKEEMEGGYEKQFHVNLGKIVPKASVDSWVQCILERYPEHLMRDAEMDYKKSLRKLDPVTTSSLFKKIDAGSPDHWTLAKRT